MQKSVLTIESAPPLMTVSELASVLRVGHNVAYRLCASKAIPSKRIGRQIRIWKEDVIKFILQNTTSPETARAKRTPVIRDADRIPVVIDGSAGV